MRGEQAEDREGRDDFMFESSGRGPVDDAVILETAMRKEAYARGLYERMYGFVEREDSRMFLERLIADEIRHYDLLQEVRHSGDFSAVGGAVVDMGVWSPDYLIQEDIHQFSGPEEIVKLAIRREEEAEEFYLSRIGFLTNNRLKILYRRLAEEEARHRQDLLAAYDDLIIMTVT